MAVGRRVRNIDWQHRTVGADPYTADVRIPGTLVAKVLRSPFPRARIRSLDVRDAERAPGVLAVVTAADLGEARYMHHGGPLADRRPLAKDVVRFVGEEIAAVAAETAEQAEGALRLIRVDYERLPAATTIQEALEDGAPAIHDAGNVALSIERHWGDVDRGRHKARARASGRYRFGRQTHACMEPNSTLAKWDPDRKVLELWTSTQAPYFIRKEVAHTLGLELDQVKTHEVAVGGGFGSKSKISEHEVLASALSLKCGRAVRLVLDRSEEFAFTKSRHDFHIELETGADPSGRLTHRAARIHVDNGAYNHSGPSVMGYATLVMGSMYGTEGVELWADLVYTNKHPGGQFRGYGGPQVTFAIESQMDELADQLGMDPIELRLLNANRAGDTTHTGWRIHSSRLTECLETVRDAIGWKEKRRTGGSGRGVGVAAAIHLTGAHVYEGAERSDAGVDLREDGRIRVRVAGADAGTGQKTVLAQIAAEELGVELSAVEVVSMESDGAPPDLGAWSSRGTFMSGHAVKEAARAAAEEVRAAAAEKWGVGPDEVALQGGKVASAHDRIDLKDLIPLLPSAVDGEARIERGFEADMEPLDPATGVANLSPTYAFAAQAVEVEVDAETGEVRVLDVVAAHDSGTVINPIAAESQVVGGVAMGLGAALGEELMYEGGRQVNPAYINYALPRAADLPTVRAIFIEQQDPVGPYGAKGLGEIALVATPAAIANAVAHATGVRIRDLPITPDKVLVALRKKEGRRARRYHLWRRPDRWWISLVRWAYPRGLFGLLDRWGTRFARTREPRRVERLERPRSAGAAAETLSGRPDAAPIAGGTDLLPAGRQGLVNPVRLVDLLALEDLRGVSENESGDLVIGAGVTLAELARRVSTTRDEVLRETISRIASPQIREMATVGGNLCQLKRCWFYRNGFPCYKRGGWTCPCYAVLGEHRHYHAAMGAHRCQAVTPSDLGTTLVALDAAVGILGSKGVRSIPLSGFFTGPGETVLRPGEILTQVRVPAAARARVSVFEKLRLWEGDFALASACVSVRLDGNGVVQESRVVLGAVAPTPYRARAAERKLAGRHLSEETIEEASGAWTWAAHPLPGNEWKLDAAAGLVRRCLARCANTWRQGGGSEGWVPGREGMG